MCPMAQQGWYDDPSGNFGLRWWDGAQWTAHTRPLPDSPDEPLPPPEQRAPVKLPGTKRPARTEGAADTDTSQPPAAPAPDESTRAVPMISADDAAQGAPSQGRADQAGGGAPHAPEQQRGGGPSTGENFPGSRLENPYSWTPGSPEQEDSGQDGDAQHPQQDAPGRHAESAAPQQGMPHQPGGQPGGQAPGQHSEQPGQQYAGLQYPGQQNPGQQPGYLVQDNQRGGIGGAAHRFNESISQGYGDQSFGGHLQGPAGATTAGADRHIFGERTIVVSQKRKIIELTNEFAIYGADGATIGSVVQVGQSGLRKAVRLMSNYDQFLTHKFELRDVNGAVLLQLTRPAKFIKSSVIVQDPQGNEIGRLIQRNAIGKIRFGLEVNGQEIGSLNAENWRAWNFAILDAQGTEVARITKTWEGLLTTMFTTADNYAVQIHFDLPDPLRSLVFAAAVTVDTALKQDDR